MKYWYASYYLVRITNGKLDIAVFESSDTLKGYCNSIFKGNFKTIKSLYDFFMLANPLGHFELFHANEVLKMIEFILNYDGVTDDLKLTALKELF